MKLPLVLSRTHKQALEREIMSLRSELALEKSATFHEAMKVEALLRDVRRLQQSLGDEAARAKSAESVNAQLEQRLAEAHARERAVQQRLDFLVFGIPDPSASTLAEAAEQPPSTLDNDQEIVEALATRARREYDRRAAAQARVLANAFERHVVIADDDRIGQEVPIATDGSEDDEDQAEAEYVQRDEEDDA